MDLAPSCLAKHLTENERVAAAGELAKTAVTEIALHLRPCLILLLYGGTHNCCYPLA